MYTFVLIKTERGWAVTHPLSYAVGFNCVNIEYSNMSAIIES